nr:MAG TPA: hypothetical protein [Caudoviricetes sp.]
MLSQQSMKLQIVLGGKHLLQELFIFALKRI